MTIDTAVQPSIDDSLTRTRTALATARTLAGRITPTKGNRLSVEPDYTGCLDVAESLEVVFGGSLPESGSHPAKGFYVKEEPKSLWARAIGAINFFDSFFTDDRLLPKYRAYVPVDGDIKYFDQRAENACEHTQ